MSDSFATPRAVVRQAPLSMEFSRQEYWSGLLFLLHKVSKPWVWCQLWICRYIDILSSNSTLTDCRWFDYMLEIYKRAAQRQTLRHVLWARASPPLFPHPTHLPVPQPFHLPPDYHAPQKRMMSSSFILWCLQNKVKALHHGICDSAQSGPNLCPSTWLRQPARKSH